METDREMVKAINKMTRQSPYFKRFNQLRYKSPKGYWDYDTVIFQMARLLTSYQSCDGSFFEQDLSHRYSIITLNQADHLGFHPYWLSHSLFDAFNHSHLPKQLGEIKQVIPVGLLFFPPKLKNPDGQFLKWILFYHRLASEPLLPIQLSKTRLEVQTRLDDSLSWITVLDDGSQYGVNHSLKLKEHQLDFHLDQIYINENLVNYGGNIEIKSEREFSDKVTEILLQTLLYIQLQPTEENSVFSPHPFNDRSSKHQPKQRLTAKIIGENYQIKQERENQSSSTKHDSPITHWRSGHWRYQPYGSRDNPQYKLKWIEPMLINA